MNSSKPSEKTLKLLLDYEAGGGQTYYEANLSRFTWPGGESGPTIAIGIDCGYYSAAELANIFSFLPTNQIELIERASGKVGMNGKQYTQELRQSNIIVHWDKAVQIFECFTWPKFTKLTEKTFPGITELHPDAYGATVSLVFNRGTKLTGDSRKEMANIKDLIPTKKYNKIAQEIRNMKRLWIGKGLDGLLERRDAEAALIDSVIT